MMLFSTRTLFAVGILALGSYSAQAESAKSFVPSKQLDRASPQYQSCLLEISKNPQSAFEAANNWRRKTGEAAPEHCEALALIELGLPKQGARTLEDLAKRPDIGDSNLRASLYTQAGNAWMLSGSAELALASFTQALSLEGLKSWVRSDLLVDRARAHTQAVDFNLAEKDLTSALDILPHHIEAIILRAGVRRQRDDPRGALADLEFALADEPENPNALVERGLLKKQMLDPVGAREDFNAVIEVAPNSSAAAIARNGLNKLSIYGTDN